MSNTTDRFIARLQEAKNVSPRGKVVLEPDPTFVRKPKSKAKGVRPTPKEVYDQSIKPRKERREDRKLNDILDKRGDDVVDAAVQHIGPDNREEHFRHWAHEASVQDPNGNASSRAREHAREHLPHADANPRGLAKKYLDHLEDKKVKEANRKYEEILAQMRDRENEAKATSLKQAKKRKKFREPETFPDKFNPRENANHAMHMRHIDATNEALGRQVDHIQHHANELMASTNQRDQEHHAREFIRHMNHYTTHGHRTIQNMRDAHAQHTTQKENDDIDAGMAATRRTNMLRFALTGKNEKRKYTADEDPKKNRHMITVETGREANERQTAIGVHSARRAENVTNALHDAISHPAISKHQAISMVRKSGLINWQLRKALRRKGVSGREIRQADIERHPYSGRARSFLGLENRHLETVKRVISEIRGGDDGAVRPGKRGARGHDSTEVQNRSGRKIRGRFSPVRPNAFDPYRKRAKVAK